MSGKLHFIFWKTQVFPVKTLWSLSRTTDLVERIRMQFFSSKIDWKSLELWHFFSILHFIYFLPIFQFFADSLPIGIWQVLINPKYIILLFFKPSFYMFFASISIFCLCTPYRIMTSPYKQKIHNLSLSWQHFILYGWAIDFNFLSIPSL